MTKKLTGRRASLRASLRLKASQGSPAKSLHRHLAQGATLNHASAGTSVLMPLMPVIIAVLAGFIIIGVALPVLPLHVEHGLGYGTFIVGVVAGAQFAGFGYSLVYPGLGIEAISGAAPQNRGMVMGIYTAFLDVAMTVGSPALGWVGGHFGLDNIFLAGALTVLSTAIVAGLLLRRSAWRKANAS